MRTAKLFKNGRSQAVRLPKEYQFRGKDVFITRFDNIVMLFSKSDPWAPLINSLNKFSDDFMEKRIQPMQKTRESLS